MRNDDFVPDGFPADRSPVYRAYVEQGNWICSSGGAHHWLMDKRRCMKCDAIYNRRESKLHVRNWRPDGWVEKFNLALVDEDLAAQKIRQQMTKAPDCKVYSEDFKTITETPEKRAGRESSLLLLHVGG
jgi:hypothetical protein